MITVNIRRAVFTLLFAFLLAFVAPMVGINGPNAAMAANFEPPDRVDCTLGTTNSLPCGHIAVSPGGTFSGQDVNPNGRQMKVSFSCPVTINNVCRWEVYADKELIDEGTLRSLQGDAGYYDNSGEVFTFRNASTGFELMTAGIELVARDE